ncbi:hypothetical protein VNO77_04301 [Canavalia gladiata]|uniref:Uncharacterized protein n=1 Tax=Canavalia gladiata TaxID=3824 RepID=A0AAN9R4P4_CANGL
MAQPRKPLIQHEFGPLWWPSVTLRQLIVGQFSLVWSLLGGESLRPKDFGLLTSPITPNSEWLHTVSVYPQGFSEQDYQRSMSHYRSYLAAEIHRLEDFKIEKRKVRITSQIRLKTQFAALASVPYIVILSLEPREFQTRAKNGARRDSQKPLEAIEITKSNPEGVKENL